MNERTSSDESWQNKPLLFITKISAKTERGSVLSTFRPSGMVLIERYRDVCDDRWTGADGRIGVNWTEKDGLGRRRKVELASGNIPCEIRDDDSYCVFITNSTNDWSVIEAKVHIHLLTTCVWHNAAAVQISIAEKQSKNHNIGIRSKTRTGLCVQRIRRTLILNELY